MTVTTDVRQVPLHDIVNDGSAQMRVAGIGWRQRCQKHDVQFDAPDDGEDAALIYSPVSLFAR